MFYQRYYKMVQNLKKLTPGFKNHMRNLENIRQAVESLKRRNSMGYFCTKIKFLQLKHYIHRIVLPYFHLPVHQIPYVISETISHFSRQNASVLKAPTLNTFDKSSSLKWKCSDFPLLTSKFTKFLMSFFKQKVSFSSKFGSLFSVMIGSSCAPF